MQAQIRHCSMLHLIMVSTVCKYISYFSRSHSLAYLWIWTPPIYSMCVWKIYPINLLRSRNCSHDITKTRLFKYTENLHQKMKLFRWKNSDVFHISAQNIDCGYSLEPSQWGGSNEYPQSMFLSRNKKNNVYPCQPLFYNIKVGFQGVKII